MLTHLHVQQIPHCLVSEMYISYRIIYREPHRLTRNFALRKLEHTLATHAHSRTAKDAATHADNDSFRRGVPLETGCRENREDLTFPSFVNTGGLCGAEKCACVCARVCATE